MVKKGARWVCDVLGRVMWIGPVGLFGTMQCGMSLCGISWCELVRRDGLDTWKESSAPFLFGLAGSDRFVRGGIVGGVEQGGS